MITGKYPSLRLRRSRKESWSRRLIQENTLSPNDFILPIFLIDGSNKRTIIYNFYHILNHANMFGGNYINEVNNYIKMILDM